MQNDAQKSWISPKDLFVVAIIISGGFITILNQTVLSPALPSIMRDYGITASEGQWLTTAFMLVNGIMIPITAYLIDRFTTRALFMGSMFIFALGTLVAGLPRRLLFCFWQECCKLLAQGFRCLLARW